MKRLLRITAVFILLFPYLSCDILRDSVFEVSSWEPGAGFQEADGIEISLLFSRAPDRIKTEQAFSLNENGQHLKGSFSWQGNRLYFTPSIPFKPNGDYLITLGIGAQDIQGLSLENKFIAEFSTRPPGERPKVVLTEPEYDGVITGSRNRVIIRFSNPVEIVSCVNNISFVPTVSGSWYLEDDGRLASFVPLDPWKTGLRYQVNIASAFSDALGRAMGEDYSFRFDTSINEDNEKPVFLSVRALHGDDEAGEIVMRNSLYADLEEYGGWDSSAFLGLEFSEPVDTVSVMNKLSVEPRVSLIMETPPGFSSSVLFRFAEKPAWQSRYLFRLNSGVRDQAGNETTDSGYWKIFVGSESSKPPVLVGMRLPLDPGNSPWENQRPVMFTPDVLYANLAFTGQGVSFPYAKEIPYRLELYFDTAPFTGVDPFSVMDLFSVEATNYALSFSPRAVKESDFTLPDPAEGWESFSRIEVQGFLVNSVDPGMVVFHIAPGLEDKLGNRNNNGFSISLMK